MSELEGEKDDLLPSESLSISLDSNSTLEECPKIFDTSNPHTEVLTAWTSITGNEKIPAVECEQNYSGECQEFLDIDLEEQDNELELHGVPISSALLEDSMKSKTRKVYPFQRAVVLHPPPNFFVLSLFATICCFLPTGIIAIVKSFETGKLYKQGMLHEAKQVSRKARYWIRVSIYIGLGLYIFIGLILCIAFLSHFTNQSDV